MTSLPFSGQPDAVSIGLNAGTTSATSISANASANVKGAWTQLSASTPIDAYGFWVYAGTHSTDNGDDFLFDIALGAAAAEAAIVTNIWRPANDSACIYIPLHIPAGQRVSARCQSSTGGATLAAVYMNLLAEDDELLATMCLGDNTFNTANAAASVGTNLAAPGSANTMTGWTQLIASTSYLTRYLFIQAAAPNSTPGSGQHIFDIGVGGAGSEQPIIANQFFDNPDFAGAQGCYQEGFWVDIPAGSRLSIRHQAQNTTADYQMQVNLLGFS